MKTPLRTFLVAGGVGLVAGTILLAKGKLGGSVAPSSSFGFGGGGGGGASSVNPDGVDIASLAPDPRPGWCVQGGGNAPSHIQARPIILEAFQKVLNRAPTPAELQYVHGVAFNETAYGKGWNEATQPGMSTANNWGAVQCDPSKMGPSDCVGGLHDQYSGGTKVSTGFRRYPTPVDGAADEIRKIFIDRPKTAQALAQPVVSALRALFAMRREHYYGGFCIDAVKKYGSQTADRSFQFPDESEGTLACQREAVLCYAFKVMDAAKAVAIALNEPLALQMGNYDDAENWYRKTFNVPLTMKGTV